MGSERKRRGSALDNMLLEIGREGGTPGAVGGRGGRGARGWLAVPCLAQHTCPSADMIVPLCRSLPPGVRVCVLPRSLKGIQASVEGLPGLHSL